MGGTPGKSQITPDEVLAQEALKRGFFKPEQLRDALSEQAREVTGGRAKARPLLNILISKGFLTTEQVTILRGGGEPEPKKDGHRLIPKEEIARGGMGAIIRAEDLGIRRQVAMKVMLDAEDEKSRSRFIEEAQVTGQLEHPNIVPVHELGVDGQGRPFFTMKLVKGRSLAHVLKTLREEPQNAKEFSLPRLLNIFTSICNGMAFAHSKGVVHRDLKPANVMLGDYGEVLVMDWGLAKVGAAKTKTGRWPEPQEAANESANQKLEDMVKSLRQETLGTATMDGAVLGTPHYLPPEQALGEIAKIDARSDIYSLGAILYELLTLQHVVEGKTLHALLKNVVDGNITPPEQRAPNRSIPRELSAVAMKALALEQKNRYQSVEDLRRDIELYLEGRAVSAKPDTAIETIAKLIKRNKGVSLATAAATGILLVVLTVSYFINLRARHVAETERSKSAQALSDFQAEQTLRLNQQRKSAPAFLQAARKAMERKDWDNALLNADAAITYDPELQEARFLKAELLIVKIEYSQAIEVLKEYVRRQPEDADAKELIAICERAAKESGNSPLIASAFAAAFARKGEHTLAEAHTRSADKLLDLYTTRVRQTWAKAPFPFQFIGMDNDGKCWLNLSGCGISDVSPLLGMRLSRLNLSGNPIANLGPLEGMPLEELDLTRTSLTNIARLRGLRLKSLTLVGTKVDDLKPLAGMALERLDLGNCSSIYSRPKSLIRDAAQTLGASWMRC